MAWESAEKVQKNANGEYRALIGGQWVPVPRAQKSADGQYRVERIAPAPTLKPATNEFENFAAGTMRGLLSPLRAAEKYGSKAVQAIGREIGRNTDSGMYEPVLQDFGQSDADRAAMDKADAPLMATTGGQIGNMVGEGAIAAIPTGAMYNAGRGLLYGGTKVLPKVLASMGSGAASGAAGAAMTGNDSPEALAIATGAGGVLAPVMHGVSKGVSSLRKVYENNPITSDNIVTKYLQDMAGDDRSKVVSALRGLTGGSEIGEKLTAGRAALADDGGYPWLKVLDQDVTLGRQAGKSAQMEQANRDIRADILRRQSAPGVEPIDPATGKRLPSPIGEDMQFNKTNRYDPSMEDAVYLSPDLENIVDQSLLNLPEGQAEKIRGLRNSVNNYYQRTPSSIPQKGGQAVVANPYGMYDGITDGMGTTLPIDTIRNLQVSKQALDAFGNDIKMPIGKTTVGDARRALTERMRTNSPLFGEAEDHFAGLSRIQNQADYAGDLLNKLEPIQGGKQNYASFLNRVSDPDAFLKQQGIENFYQSPEHLFGNAPGRLDEINALRRSVEREVKYGQIPGHKGLTDELTSGLTQAERAAPPLFTPLVTTTKRAMKILGSQQEKKAFDMLDNLVLNPGKMAEVIDSTPVSQRSAVVNYLRNLSSRRGDQIVGGAAGLAGQQIGENYAP